MEATIPKIHVMKSEITLTMQIFVTHHSDIFPKRWQSFTYTIMLLKAQELVKMLLVINE